MGTGLITSLALQAALNLYFRQKIPESNRERMRPNGERTRPNASSERLKSYLNGKRPVTVIIAIAIPFIIFFLSSQIPENRLKLEGWATLSQFDPVGTIFFVAGIICLLISLQWGGAQYPWSDGRIIALLTIFGVLIIVWVVAQWRGGDNATVPLRILRQRTVTCSTFYIFFASASFVLLIYYLPIW